MKWEGNGESDNVEDRRGESGGGGGGFRGGSIGVGGIVVAAIAYFAFGVNPMTVLNLMSGGSGGSQVQQAPAHPPPPSDRTARLVSTVLRDTEDTWTEIFQANGKTYVKPKLVLFSNSYPTGCGQGEAAAGPFYCPADRKVYIDLSFFQLMRDRFHVSSEFAEAYVIAHEVGHHVQNLLGYSRALDQARQQHLSESEVNHLSVRLELQADCFAGVWANHANKARSILEQGDVEAALNTASAIGDDTLQKQSRGEVVPDSFTHGTSAQRVRWFTRGIESGDVGSCDTASARQL